MIQFPPASHRFSLACLCLGVILLHSTGVGADTIVVRDLPTGENALTDFAFGDNGKVAYGLFENNTFTLYKQNVPFVSDGPGSQFAFLGGNLRFGDSGLLAFLAYVDANGNLIEGLHTGPNPDLDGPDQDGIFEGDTIIDERAPGFLSFDLIDVNAHDDVLFLQSEGGFRRRLRVSLNGGQTFVDLAEQPDADSVILSPSFNDARTVAWVRRVRGAETNYVFETRSFDASGIPGPIEERITVDSNLNALGLDVPGLTGIGSARIGPAGNIVLSAGSQNEFDDSGVFLVSAEGAVTTIAVNRSADDQSPFSRFSSGPLRIDSEGTVWFLAEFNGEIDGQNRGTVGWFRSTNLSRPFVGTGHEVLPGWIANEIEGGDVDCEGNVLTYVKMYSTDFLSERESLLIADGTTDFPPIEADKVFWSSTAGGEFGQSGNWEPAVVPSGQQTAVFDLDNTYAVATAGQSVYRAIVDRGAVTIEGLLELTGGNTNAPSLSVGEDAAASPALRLQSPGTVLNSQNIAIAGQQSAGSAILEVDSNAQVFNSGRVTVGGLAGSPASQDSLIVSGGGKLGTAKLVAGRGVGSASVTITGQGSEMRFSDDVEIGDTSEASLTVSDGGKLVGEPAQITIFRTGVQASGNANVIVDGEGSAISAYALGVGLSGTAKLTVSGRARVTTEDFLLLSSESSSNGTLEILGDFSDLPLSSVQVGTDLLLIEDAGDSKVTIEGGKLEVGSRFAVVGSFSAPDDAAVSMSEAIVLVGSELSVRHDSTLTASDQTVISSATGIVDAAEDGGMAYVTLVDSTWDIDGGLVIGNETAQSVLTTGEGVVNLQDSALVEAAQIVIYPGGHINGAGTLIGEVQAEGGAIGSFLNLIAGRSQKGGGVQNGLTIDGNLTAEQAELGFQAAGPTLSDWSKLAVDGNAELSESVIRVSFAAGYAPPKGTKVPLIETGGKLNVEKLRFQYEGAEPGFQFQATVGPEGALEFEALNDGVPWAADTLFRTSFGPRFINVE